MNRYFKYLAILLLIGWLFIPQEARGCAEFVALADAEVGEVLVLLGAETDPAKAASLMQEVSDLYQDRLMAYFIKRGFKEDLAEDLTHDTLVKIWKRRTTFVDRGNARAHAWVYRVANSVLVDFTRKPETKWEKRRSSGSDPEDDFLDRQTDTAQAPPSQSLETEETRKHLLEAIQSLEPGSTQAEVMKALNAGKTPNEIAEKLGLPLGTVKSAIRLAREKIEAYLQLSPSERMARLQSSKKTLKQIAEQMGIAEWMVARTLDQAAVSEAKRQTKWITAPERANVILPLSSFERSIASLTNRNREIMRAYYLEQLPLLEVMKRFDMKQATVQTVVVESLAAMRAELDIEIKIGPGYELTIIPDADFLAHTGELPKPKDPITAGKSLQLYKVPAETTVISQEVFESLLGRIPTSSDTVEKKKTILRLYFVDGLAAQTIADRYGTSEAAVLGMINRALPHFGRLLDKPITKGKHLEVLTDAAKKRREVFAARAENPTPNAVRGQLEITKEEARQLIEETYPDKSDRLQSMLTMLLIDGKECPEIATETKQTLKSVQQALATAIKNLGEKMGFADVKRANLRVVDQLVNEVPVKMAKFVSVSSEEFDQAVASIKSQSVRLALRLRWVEGYSLAEAAKILSRNESTVKNDLTNGFKALAVNLGHPDMDRRRFGVRRAPRVKPIPLRQ